MAGGIAPEDDFFSFSLCVQDQIVDAIKRHDALRACNLRVADLRAF
jgi:hypothetical protein